MPAFSIADRFDSEDGSNRQGYYDVIASVLSDRMPIAEVNGVKLSYSAQGEGEPVVLIGGFGGDINFYHALIPTLARKHRVIVLDNRGAGATVYDGPFEGQDMVDDVVALLDSLSVYKAHVFGWSMGGHIAQEFAIQNPDRTKSLTLASAYMKRPARSSYFMNSIVRAASEGADPRCIAMMINAFCFTTDYFEEKEAKGSSIAVPKEINVEGLLHQLRALDEFDTRSRARMIKSPTLSVHGLDDIMVEPKLGDDLADQIDNCRRLRIPGAGHIMKPALYADAFLEHIARNSRRS